MDKEERGGDDLPVVHLGNEDQAVAALNYLTREREDLEARIGVQSQEDAGDRQGQATTLDDPARFGKCRGRQDQIAAGIGEDGFGGGAQAGAAGQEPEKGMRVNDVPYASQSRPSSESPRNSAALKSSSVSA